MNRLSILSIVLLLIGTLAKAQPLKGVTLGFGAGYHHSITKKYDYFLAADDNYSLKMDPLSASSFVISTVVNIKLTPLVKVNEKLHKRLSGSQQNSIRTQKTGGVSSVVEEVPFEEKRNWKDKITLHLGINLAEVSSNVTFNKSIDGGIGAGYILSEHAFITLMADLSKYRKMRDYYSKKYNNKPIPNGSGFYTTLSSDDNTLFQSKTSVGLSIKFVMGI
jgi:hypothetical protein